MNIRKEDNRLLADRDIYATLDGRLVEERDPAANSLIALKGKPIPAKLVARFGIKPTPIAKVVKVEEPKAQVEFSKPQGFQLSHHEAPKVEEPKLVVKEEPKPEPKPEKQAPVIHRRRGRGR